MMKLLVFSCMVAAACGSSIISPFGYSATPYFGGYSSFGYPGYSSFGYPGFNYRGPLSLVPGQPASILAADGRPLDTLDVNLDKSAHFTAKALEGSGVHLLKKRSAPVFATPYFGGYSSFGYPGYYSFGYPGFNYRGPLSLAPGQPASILAADGRPLDTLDVNLDKSAHFTAKALEGSGVHLLKKRSAPVFAGLVTAPFAAPLTLPYAGINYASPYGYTSYSGYNGLARFSGHPTPFAYYK